MKTVTEISSDKLRGGFYSPDALVEVCLNHVVELVEGREGLTILEPSAGDGGFIRGLSRHALGERVSKVTAVEVDPSEAAKARSSLSRVGLPGEVIGGSVLEPGLLTSPYDVALGNPPFVRFQFLSQLDRQHIEDLGRKLGVPFRGVSNLWIPVFLTALGNLRDGGVFSFIVPAECFTGLSARAVRAWLGQHATQLSVDLFPPRSFPGVLQEIVVLSGQITRGSSRGARVLVHDHSTGGSWAHVLGDDEPTWTGLLLPPDNMQAVRSALSTPGVLRFGRVAKLSVATVTGANDFFCVDELTREMFELEKWTRPLLDRVRHAPGLAYTEDDQIANVAAGHRAWLLDSGLDSELTAGAAAYVGNGEIAGLHSRYKTRIRTPWWRVPVVAPGALLLSKRSNHYPRLIRNIAGAATTDTVYQGSPLPDFVGRERDIVGSFHNSLTLLTAEMNGRSFGGGVLELVPTEVASLALPLTSVTAHHFDSLDLSVRSAGSDPDSLIDATDQHVIENLNFDMDTWDLVREARKILRDRRLSRN